MRPRRSGPWSSPAAPLVLAGSWVVQEMAKPSGWRYERSGTWSAGDPPGIGAHWWFSQVIRWRPRFRRLGPLRLPTRPSTSMSYVVAGTPGGAARPPASRWPVQFVCYHSLLSRSMSRDSSQSRILSRKRVSDQPRRHRCEMLHVSLWWALLRPPPLPQGHADGLLSHDVGPPFVVSQAAVRRDQLEGDISASAWAEEKRPSDVCPRVGWLRGHVTLQRSQCGMRVSADDDRCRRVRVGVTIGVQHGFQGTQLGYRGLTELAGSNSDLELGRKAMVTSLPPRLTPPSAEPSDRIQAARDGKGAATNSAASLLTSSVTSRRPPGLPRGRSCSSHVSCWPGLIKSPLHLVSPR